MIQEFVHRLRQGERNQDQDVPFCKLTMENHGESTIYMVIFGSYVSLSEGMWMFCFHFFIFCNVGKTMSQTFPQISSL